MIKIFAHRGFAQNNIKQNSIASLKNAFKNGFKAIEFDIWWLENQLFLSHDKPSKTSLLISRILAIILFIITKLITGLISKILTKVMLEKFCNLLKMIWIQIKLI